jgi:hypothetical protein
MADTKVHVLDQKDPADDQNSSGDQKTADSGQNGKDTKNDSGVSDADAAKLLEGDDEDDDPDGADQLGDAGKKALDRMKQRIKDAKTGTAAEKKRADELAEKLKQYEDAKLSDSERATRDRDEFKTRAEKAEAQLSNRELAEELAEELDIDISVKDLKAVARRITGDTEEARKKDAAELFELLGAKKSTSKVDTRPKEKLQGGGDPTNEPEEMNPAKLAALIPRES